MASCLEMPAVIPTTIPAYIRILIHYELEAHLLNGALLVSNLNRRTVAFSKKQKQKGAQHLPFNNFTVPLHSQQHCMTTT